MSSSSVDFPFPTNPEAAAYSFVFECHQDEDFVLRDVASWNLLAVSFQKYNTCSTFPSRMPLCLGYKRKRETGPSKMLAVREMAKNVLIHLFSEQIRPEECSFFYDEEEAVSPFTLIVTNMKLRMLVGLHSVYLEEDEETRGNIRLRVKEIFETLFPIQRMNSY